MTGEEFLQQLDYFANAWLPARDIVAKALEERKEVDPSGQIVVFKQVNEVGASRLASADEQRAGRGEAVGCFADQKLTPVRALEGPPLFD
jgi:hypothetical protein